VHAVVFDLEVGDAGALALARLQRQQKVVAVGLDGAQLVELGVEAGPGETVGERVALEGPRVDRRRAGEVQPHVDDGAGLGLGGGEALVEAAGALEALDFVGLAGDANRIAGQLPYGDQRRLEIARALATGARLILLDEPAAALDFETERIVIDVARFDQRIQDKLAPRG